MKQQSAAFALGSQDWASEKEELVKAHEEALKALEEKYKQDTSELAEVIEETKTSVNEQAAQIVAGIGIEADKIKVEAKELPQTNKKGFKTISHLPKKP